ncbi:hypothetical protein K469DRAFT_308652 [Zopfia rhizophila CBS 207.26]|uniref:Uncharacterized protein n=1 Tax=Zopfia rhizophila CBS 207.26 TaxID=1314779 RepID=A0A6A6ELV6_9PEZI|nr:hypothetical protein K469DRAFT_308652 [Zopfia rhizophila CBS 207.26]
MIALCISRPQLSARCVPIIVMILDFFGAHHLSSHGTTLRMSTLELFKLWSVNQNDPSAPPRHVRYNPPLVLVRATHTGNHDGSIPPASQIDRDGDIYPRDFRGPITKDDAALHLDEINRDPTPSLSFTTWYEITSRINVSKLRKVQNIWLHFIIAFQLPSTTEIYPNQGLGYTL